MADKTILVVDDVGYTRLLFDRVLSKEGYKVLHAEKGSVALKVIKNEMVNLVLLDMNLPDTTGLELLKKFRKLRRKLPVIIITASDTSKWMDEVDELGVSDIFCKPVDINELKIKIGEYLTPMPSVLVVDDEEHCLFFLKELLTKSGYRVITALDGIAAKRLIDYRNICLVILDLNLPGMDGAELCRRLYQEETRLPILIYSAYINNTIFTELKTFGVRNYILKPGDKQELLRMVGNEIGGYEDYMVENIPVLALWGRIEVPSFLAQRIKDIYLTSRALIINTTAAKQFSSYSLDVLRSFIGNYSENSRLVIHKDQSESIFRSEEERGLVFFSDIDAAKDLKETPLPEAPIKKPKDKIVVIEKKEIEVKVEDVEKEEKISIGSSWFLKAIPTNEVVVGMVLGKPIYSQNHKNVLITEGMEINDSNIGFIQNLGIDKVTIRTEEKPVIDSSKKTTRHYRK